MTRKLRYLMTLCILLCPLYAGAQVPETISAGIYGRGESNLYRYYSGQQLGDFFSRRASNAYSAGIAVQSSVTYLFNAMASFGFSEVTFRPDIRSGSSTLYQASLRLWHLNMAGELKFNDQGTFNPAFWFGLQGIFRQSATEIFSAGRVSERTWPKNRMMPQFGVAFYYKPRKSRFNFRAEAGMRLNSNNRTGYDYGLSQAFAGLSILYRVKSW